MKSIALFTLSLIATAAMAGVTTHPPGGGTGGTGPQASEVVINGTSVQVTALANSGVGNKADYGGKATQNLASNAGKVEISGTSVQVVAAANTGIWNEANGKDAVAVNNLASNYGDVTVKNGGTSVQVVAAYNTGISNVAYAGSRAVQNISSNNGCTTCN